MPAKKKAVQRTSSHPRTPLTRYHHVASKDEVLDGIVDLIMGEIDLPAVEGDWRASMRSRAVSARS